MLVLVLLLKPLLLCRLALLVLAGELEAVRLLALDEVSATAEGVVTLVLDDEGVGNATWAFEMVDVILEVVPVITEGIVDGGGWAGFGCGPRIEQPRS